mmetsp:Transcript_43183/g.119439  ORF Transcript_43183/g.119439 Transcript_43183/m.119439 type:complete len:125 (-) Transcript_43183:114-488(-)
MGARGQTVVRHADVATPCGVQNRWAPDAWNLSARGQNINLTNWMTKSKSVEREPTSTPLKILVTGARGQTVVRHADVATFCGVCSGWAPDARDLPAPGDCSGLDGSINVTSGKKASSGSESPGH